MKVEPIPQDELEDLLNESLTSRDGLLFSPAEDTWALTHTSSQNVLTARASYTFPPEVRPYFRLALARYARSYSPDSVKNIAQFCYMIPSDNPDIPNNWLDEACFISAKARLGKRREYQLATIRGFLKFWLQSGLYGIDPHYFEAISKVRIRGNEKGTRISSEDVLNGPLTELEHRAVLDGTTNAYMSNHIGTQQYLLIKLFSERGMRRSQAAQLFISDFYERGGEFWIKQPRAKQRNTGWREAFKEFRVSETLYSLVQLLGTEYAAAIKKTCGEEFTSQIDDLPLFPNMDRLADALRLGKKIDAYCCWSRENFTTAVRSISRHINAISERTGDPIHLIPQRFRYSLGSDLDKDGRGVGVIAAALDHEDEQNAGVYVGLSDAMAHRLDAKIGPLLAPLAQAFSGVVVKSEKDAVRGSDPSSRIRTIDGSDNVGTCGNMAFCGANAPISCYTCSKFYPWLDGPHEEVLTDLYEEREEILRVTGDRTMAEVNDRVILAVESVVRRCSEMRNQGVQGE
ncbi:tyrosine-type recombinase/integrase [Marinobacter sp. NFXS11]|uniref:site-specific integrase n=1 Tax=Marinobacter sp. NFXS11 TaxID=2818432 RepID=UPI0032DE3C48